MTTGNFGHNRRANRVTRRISQILVCGFAICAALAPRSASAADLDLVCTGNSYGKDGPFPTPETISFKTSAAKRISFLPPGEAKAVEARVVSNNDIQLKFATGRVTGEYFYYSGDLFLIHRSGRFTKLLCKPSMT